MERSERYDRLNRELDRALHEDAIAAINCLSAKERSVLLGLVNGKSKKTLSEDLGITPDAAAALIIRTRKKLSASTTADAVRIGIYAGLDEIGGE